MPYEKVGKNDPVCIADEVPFDIPDSWEWVRISSLGSIIRGSGIKRTEVIKEGKPCVRYGELYTTYHTSFTQAISFIPESLYQRCKHFSYGDILMTLTGENKPDIAKAVVYLGNDEVAAGGDMAFWTSHGMNPFFLTYLMASPYVIGRKVELATGDIIVHISGSKLGSILIPIPPLKEQHRIVEKIKEIEPLLELYDNAYNEVTRLNEAFPDQLKKSILQEAVQGKLVPQDPNDEPASVLLERIREEKQQLIKEGRIKKDKRESIIYRRDNSHYEKLDGIERCIDDEIPFEIPETWCWCRLSEIATVIRGLTFSSSSKEMKNGLSLVLRGGNIDSKTEKLNFMNNIYVDNSIIKDIQFLRKGDTLIVASSGTKSSVGKSCYIDEDLCNVSFGSFMMTVRPSQQIIGEYIAVNIKLYRQKIIASTAGYISNITNPILNNLLIPLPPINEQKQIIKVINTLISYLEKL